MLWRCDFLRYTSVLSRGDIPIPTISTIADFDRLHRLYWRWCGQDARLLSISRRTANTYRWRSDQWRWDNLLLDSLLGLADNRPRRRDAWGLARRRRLAVDRRWRGYLLLLGRWCCLLLVQLLLLVLELVLLAKLVLGLDVGDRERCLVV